MPTTYDDPVIEELKSIWESKKEYIDKDLWVIRNFLSQEEIDWIMKEANDPDGWYITMRSLYLNVGNKYLDLIPSYNEDGIMISQFDPVKFNKQIPFFKEPHGIENRLMAVLPKHFIGTTTLQSFFAIREDNEDMKQLAKEHGAEEIDMSFPWHCEEEAKHPITGAKMTAAFSLYLNDNFSGGELKFLNKPDIVIKPEPGMLVNVPTSKEFTHKVSFVKDGDRHTIYGNCWDDISIRPISTMEDC
jgi:hypothetical protein